MAAITEEINVGVLMLGDGIQLLDFAGIDCFDVMTPKYMEGLRDFVPPEATRGAVPFKIVWITENDSSHPITGQTKVDRTHSMDDCPPLDILFVPGPEVGYRITPKAYAFINHQMETLSAAMSVCTGVQALLQAGICEGKTVSGPLPMQQTLQKFFPGVTFSPKRWATDMIPPRNSKKSEKKALDGFDRSRGIELWTSGGVMNGIDQVAAFLRAKFPGPTIEAALGIVDAPCRSQDY